MSLLRRHRAAEERTVKGKVAAMGNAVPLPMARALARAVRAALKAEVDRAPAI
jgi:hypothetical protein